MHTLCSMLVASKQAALKTFCTLPKLSLKFPQHYSVTVNKRTEYNNQVLDKTTLMTFQICTDYSLFNSELLNKYFFSFT